MKTANTDPSGNSWFGLVHPQPQAHFQIEWHGDFLHVLPARNHDLCRVGRVLQLVVDRRVEPRCGTTVQGLPGTSPGFLGFDFLAVRIEETYACDRVKALLPIELDFE